MKYTVYLVRHESTSPNELKLVVDVKDGDFAGAENKALKIAQRKHSSSEYAWIAMVDR